MPLIFNYKNIGILVAVMTLALIVMGYLFFYSHLQGRYCMTGAFLADQPTTGDIEKFTADYGKRPRIVLIFLDWGKFPEQQVIRDVYGRGSILMITWEPWDAVRKTGIDPAVLCEGKYDEYIRRFALKLKAIGQPVFLRFAHEMNGNWYPWSGQKISPESYQEMYRYIHDAFSRVPADNVQWVFSINAENVPSENEYVLCYPGDRYVDYVGLDGYNWGTTQSWSRWRSFKEIFSSIYRDVNRRHHKPIIISEFSSTSVGGDKAKWIEEALRDIKAMPAVKGFVLFNLDKETDWRFPPASASGKKLNERLRDSYFKNTPEKTL